MEIKIPVKRRESNYFFTIAANVRNVIFIKMNSFTGYFQGFC